jgi:hypothetical protein
MYMRNIGELIEGIRKLLKPNGMVFIHVGDFTKNAYTLLAGDQYYYYSYSILSNVFGFHGFELSQIDSTWFPREIVAIARPQGGARENSFVNDSQVYKGLEDLASIYDELGKLNTASSSNVGVLGTTWAAAFVDSVLASELDFFVDENPGRVGRSFRSKNVIHPESLDSTCEVIIPYGTSSQGIKDRFVAQYEGRYITL